MAFLFVWNARFWIYIILVRLFFWQIMFIVHTFHYYGAIPSQSIIITCPFRTFKYFTSIIFVLICQITTGNGIFPILIRTKNGRKKTASVFSMNLSVHILFFLFHSLSIGIGIGIGSCVCLVAVATFNWIEYKYILYFFLLLLLSFSQHLFCFFRFK